MGYNLVEEPLTVILLLGLQRVTEEVVTQMSKIVISSRKHIIFLFVTHFIMRVHFTPTHSFIVHTLDADTSYNKLQGSYK